MSKIGSKFIIEILGRPPEHLESSLNDLVDRLGTEKGISVISKNFGKPKPVEKVDNLWTAFADVELNFETLAHFFNAIMAYMPAHVEVFEPENFKFSAFELNELANFMVSKMHNYDAVAKKLMGEREILIRKLEHLRTGGKLEDVFPKEQQAKPIVKERKKTSKSKKGKK